jgi:flagellar hook-associated protein FlgK
MSDMLGIASNAIGAYQRALSTVSNNIANVNTEGYSRQDVVLKDSAPKKLASMYVGTGVMLQNIKRQYDEFAESNLRNSNSDLSSQTPMVDYTKRVMDIMGDKNIGLSSALDAFFASASDLSTDPASTVLRTSFLRSAEGVASRFGELSTQLDLVATETKQGLESVAAKINTLTGQLALINQSMSRSFSLEGQPPELLDRRDLTLRQLSELVRTKVIFATNGTVNVSLGSTMKEGVVVDGQKARPIGLTSSTSGKLDFVLDPYGTTEPLPAISGGLMGGYQAFISQVLDPSQKNLNSLAQTFVNETNTVQRNGIDGYGQIGADLFAIDGSKAQAAAGVNLSLTDGLRVATAAQFRVSEGNTNITTTRASVRFSGEKPSNPLSNTGLVNNPNASAGVTFKVDGSREFVPVTTMAAGVGATFYFDEAEQGQQLQVLTRDGRQLLGQTLSESEKYQLFKPANGFVADAVYSNKYLNKSGDYAYRGLDLFYGAKAETLYRQNFDANGFAMPSVPIPALLETGRIASLKSSIAAGAMQLNGFDLGELTPKASTDIQISGLNLGTAVGPKFNFTALVDGTAVSMTNFSVTSMADLAAQIKAKLRATDALGASNFDVSLINNDEDILITDGLGRDITNFSLTPAADATDAVAGDIEIRSAAIQVANWLNGNSQVKFSGITFGDGATKGFSDFQMNLGGVDYSFTNLNAITTVNELAAELQTKFREEDETSNISVVVSEGQLVFTDKLGRNIKNVKLTRVDETAGSNSGTMVVTNSVADQSHVRAFVSSVVKAPVTGIDLKKPLSINGQAITLADNIDSLVDNINAANAGVIASLKDGDLVLNDPQGSPITINASVNGNSLNISPGTYGGQVQMMQVVKDFRVAATDLDFQRPLEINGISILGVPNSIANIKDMVATINAKVHETGVVASVDEYNDLKLSVADPKGNLNISIGPGKKSDGSYFPNTLGLEPMEYGVTQRLTQALGKDPVDPTEVGIRLSFGSYTTGDPPVETHGDPYDMSVLGLRTGAYIEGGCPDDLLLFVTGKGSAKVAVGFEGQPDNPRDNLRSQSLLVKFTAADRYSIIDAKTGTELADRHYDPSVLEPTIEFQGLELKLSHAASVGDVFKVDGNQDGLGNNVNMLDMFELSKRPVSGGKTIGNTYIDQINTVGNLSQQAIITQEALKVVNEQAIQSRDKVAGVNLDDEAAALVRYQQAYQAAAKALQISGQLFDAVVQIN